MTPGLIIAAPNSNAGKTTVTLALLRAFRQAERPGAFKCGPDYIDPGFHAQAAGCVCYNLDPWAMSNASLASIIAYHSSRSICLVEGVMGLFDGAADGTGSTADLARRTGWPVVLVVDCKGLSDSVAPLVTGFVNFDPQVDIAGVILNRVGSPNHEARLRAALAKLNITVFGSLQRCDNLSIPRRHLGLLQAHELPNLDARLNQAANEVQRGVDLEALVALAKPSRLLSDQNTLPWVPDLGPRIAIADDTAFAFCYPHWRRRWQDNGVALMPFSPLENCPPPSDASGVFLPGGYPELHADTLASATQFSDGLRAHAKDGRPIYGECGGFMVLGETLEDGDGKGHSMSGLLPVSTSYASPRLHLGYRRLSGALPAVLNTTSVAAHEFHYSTQTVGQDSGSDARVTDANGQKVDCAVHTVGQVSGSYLHVIDGHLS